VTRASLAAGASILNLTARADHSPFTAWSPLTAAVIICFMAGNHVREVGDFDLRADPIPLLHDFFARQIELASAAAWKYLLDPGSLLLPQPAGQLRARAPSDESFLNTFRLRDLGFPLPGAAACLEFFREEVRSAEPFFALLAALGKRLVPHARVPRIRPCWKRSRSIRGKLTVRRPRGGNDGL